MSESTDPKILEIYALHDVVQQVFFRRESAGLTQEQLAERAGMTQAQITAIECGRANPTVRSLAKLAAAHGCTVFDLLTPETEGE